MSGAKSIKSTFHCEQVSTGMQSLEKEKNAPPKSTQLLSNYPNPFNASTKIRYIVEENLSSVKVIIYNSLGQQVKILVNENKSSGEYLIEWDGRNETAGVLPSGVYFCKIELNGKTCDWAKMILLR